MKEAYAVIKRLLLTEKGARLAEKENKYLFEVDRNANKLDIKRAVEQVFKVHVQQVNSMHRRGKKKRERTANFGMTAAWKRAVVTVQGGEKIDLT